MTTEDRLRLHLAGKDVTWRTEGPTTIALWTEDGAPRAILLPPQPPTAAAIVDAYVAARATGARLTLLHEGALSPVAQRSASRFGLALLDAATLPDPAPAEETPLPPAAPVLPGLPVLLAAPTLDVVLAPEVAPPPMPEETPAPFPPYEPLLLLAPHEAEPLLLLPAPDADASSGPLSVEEAPMPLAPLDAPAVAPAPAVDETPEAPAVEEAPPLLEPPALPAPPEVTLTVAVEGPAPDAAPAPLAMLPDMETAFAWMDAPPVALLPDAEAAFASMDAPPIAMLPDMEAAFAWMDAPPVADAAVLLDASAADPVPEPLSAVAAPAEAPSVVEVAVVAEPDAAPAVELPPMPAPEPVAEAALPVASVTVEPGLALPWDVAAPAPQPEPVVQVTAAELAALPWHVHAPIEEHVEVMQGAPRARRFVDRPTVTGGAPDGASWGLPWPRPVAPTDGLSIADPRLWASQERVHAVRENLDAQMGAASFGAVKPEGSPWIRRLQSFGTP